MPYLSASVAVIHYKEVLYQVYAPLTLTLPLPLLTIIQPLILTGVSRSPTDVADDGRRPPASQVGLDDPCSAAEGRAEHHRTEGSGVLLSLTTAAEAALLGTAGSWSAVRWPTAVASMTVAAGYLICLHQPQQQHTQYEVVLTASSPSSHDLCSSANQ